MAGTQRQGHEEQVPGSNDRNGMSMEVDEQEGQEERDNESSISERSGQGQGRNYKDMLSVLKQIHKRTDGIAEQICSLNFKYAEIFSRATVTIDPELVKIAHDCANIVDLDKSEDLEQMNSSQNRFRKLPQPELDQKYMAMSQALDEDKNSKN